MLVLTGEAWEAMQAHARAAGASEACGLLLGDRAGPLARVVAARAARNLADDPARGYLLDPGDWLAAAREAERSRLDLLGYYHSHPDGTPAPSSADLAGAWPGHFYLIVTGSPSAFLVEDGRARHVPVVVE